MKHPTRTTLRLRVAVITATVFCLMTGLATAAGSPAVYKVRSGDNLSVIGARFGVTVNDLKKANGLSSDLLSIGQELTISKPFRRTGRKDVRWTRPSNKLGRVLRPYGQYKKGSVLMPRTGVDLACPVGTKLVSPANGVVRHVGPMDGFGLLVIIEHGGGYATVFSPFDAGTVAVEVNQAVLPGDHLGRTGPPPEKDTPAYLHVELRKNDKAIKPDPLLR
mgnify:CR=1 FL=1